MERCAALLEKLNNDFAQNASPEQLMITLQMFQKELQTKVVHPKQKSGRIAIVMPNSFQTNIFEHTSTVNTTGGQLTTLDAPIVLSKEEEAQPATTEVSKLLLIQEDEDDDEEALDYDLPKIIASTTADSPNTIETTANTDEAKEQPTTKLILVQEDDDEDDDIPEYILPNLKPIDKEHIVFEELPTVAQQTSIQENVGTNNTQTTHSIAVSNTNPESTIEDDALPIKDLKKAISLNDKFVFINELFRGDESMYDRSLKTINNFSIYPEAQFWIERELKTKIGWDAQRETVQHFYDLVRRRFANT